jgi:hypothetical protein
VTNKENHMTDERRQEYIRRYNEGMRNMTAAQASIYAAEQADCMRNAYPDRIDSTMLAQASMNFWRQDGPLATGPIQIPPHPTMWARIKRWLLA